MHGHKANLRADRDPTKRERQFYSDSRAVTSKDAKFCRFLSKSLLPIRTNMKLELAPPLLVEQPADLSLPLGETATRAKSAGGTFAVQRYRFTSGKREGVELVVIDSGKVRAAICPTRGMGLWKANLDGLDCSWRSPVEGPVHPQFVPVAEPNGLGWLDGFDELLVRCGLQSFGAPDFNDKDQLKFPLHGRIANQPAVNWSVHLDADHSLLEVRGEVHETRFLQFNLRLSVSYRFAFGQPVIEVVDTVRNASNTPTTMQMLYHVNVGTPLLDGGATIHSAAKRIVARDQHAADDLNDWSTYLPPTPAMSNRFTSRRRLPLPMAGLRRCLHPRIAVVALLSTTRPTHCPISRSGRTRSVQPMVM